MVNEYMKCRTLKCENPREPNKLHCIDCIIDIKKMRMKALLDKGFTLETSEKIIKDEDRLLGGA